MKHKMWLRHQNGGSRSFWEAVHAFQWLHKAQTGSSNEHFTVNLHREVYLPGLSVVFEFTPPTWRLALRQWDWVRWLSTSSKGEWWTQKGHHFGRQRNCCGSHQVCASITLSAKPKSDEVKLPWLHDDFIGQQRLGIDFSIIRLHDWNREWYCNSTTP